jgi:murein L,D-transpeptidase YafK
MVMIATAENGTLIPDPLLNLFLAGESNRTIFIAELSSQKAYLLSFTREPLSLHISKEFSISSGKQKGAKRSEWDLRTPEGAYEITQFRPKDSLEEKFGTGAFILDYPNRLDRILKKTGSGIWIHGNDRIDFIDFDSEGCIRLKNADLTFLQDRLIPRQTPVYIVDKIIWHTETEILRKKSEINERINSWIKAQEEQDLVRYLSFYHPTFYSTAKRMDIAEWTISQRERFAQNEPLTISLEELYYIYQDNYLLIQGREELKKEAGSENIRKSILWKQIDDHWYIVAENSEN